MLHHGDAVIKNSSKLPQTVKMASSLISVFVREDGFWVLIHLPYEDKKLNDLCGEREKKKVFLRFHVYGTFYSHLFDRVIQQMATHQHRPQKSNKNRITAIAFGKHHLAPLIASTAATFAINPKYIKALHQQMKRLKSVRVSRLKLKYVAKCCNLVYKVWWVVPVVNHMVKGHSWHIVNHFMITMQETFK